MDDNIFEIENPSSIKSTSNPYKIFVDGLDFYKNNLSKLNKNKKNEIEKFLLKLLDAAPAQFNVKISIEICNHDYLPLKIVRYLALKPIDIAKPILTHSKILSERDLLVVTSVRGDQHRAVIAARADVTFAISSKLVEKGDEEVMRILTENLNALISQKTFRIIGDKSSNNENLKFLVLNRNDITIKSTEYLLEKFNLAELNEINEKADGPLKIHLEIKIDKLNTNDNFSYKLNDETNAELQNLNQIQKQYLETKITEKALIDAINSGTSDIVICFFSTLTGLGLEDMLECISNADARKFAIASKAKGLKQKTLEEILNSDVWRATPSREKVSDAVRTYKNLKQNIACELLKK
ncbi:MAG: DUF2336 domain-containing protein [Hyphomicrobiales bacterium]